MSELVRRWREQGLSIGLVPTMGALHEGHASLIRRARRGNDRVVVSIFVNPAQFGPGEDYARYPRALSRDLALCRRCGADAVYHPGVSQVYPEGFSTAVQVSGLSERLEGKFRPGHFRGVATVVLKLLETTRPERAYFGEKDYQQLTLVRRMASDLDLGVAIVGCPTARQPDGLALSSRNAYLSPRERALAPAIHAALVAARGLARGGASPKAVERRARARILASIPQARVDYVELVDARTLRPAERARGRLRLLAAVWLGKTRLIDNIPVFN
ncbi:MAG: pantoate--beta-alanine ligase [Elusimicrobia bacterium]|nr:pantoate--beta-alanine ligase [Elusimicrobiota bacterium]MDE2425812.1 pantoate--beta-alanine ligase [Elusimicrobiota bacterium]